MILGRIVNNVEKLTCHIHKSQLSVPCFLYLSLLTVFGNKNLAIVTTPTLSDILMILGRIVHKAEKACLYKKHKSGDPIFLAILNLHVGSISLGEDVI